MWIMGRKISVRTKVLDFLGFLSASAHTLHEFAEIHGFRLLLTHWGFVVQGQCWISQVCFLFLKRHVTKLAFCALWDEKIIVRTNVHDFLGVLSISAYTFYEFGEIYGFRPFLTFWKFVAQS